MDTPSTGDAVTRTEKLKHQAEVVDSTGDAVIQPSPGDAPTLAATGRSPEDFVMPTRIGRFLVLRTIGSGGMGVVYAAFDEVLERQVALKLVRGHHVDAVSQTRMMREAQSLARLSHPNVVQIYEVGQHGSQIYLAMELIKGQTLAAWAEGRRVRGDLLLNDVIEVFLAAGEGLAAAHRVGVVHRDFKPSNVIVGDDGRVCVLDFGLAAAAARTPNEDEKVSLGAFQAPLTIDGAIVGTPAYMAPEQFAGHRGDTRADIYSYSVALHEVLHGARPFAADNVATWLVNIRGNHRQEPVSRDIATAWITRIVDRGLAADPSHRWPSMQAYLDTLRNSPARRKKRIVWALGLFGVCTLIVAIWVATPFYVQRGCHIREQTIAKLWNSDVREAIETAFAASGSAHAHDTWKRADEKIEQWVDEWRKTRYETCVSDTTQSQRLLRDRCLQQQKWQLEGLLQSFREADKSLVNQAVRATLSLPSNDRCQDEGWLSTHFDEVDEDEELTREVLRLRLALSMGRFKEVHARIAELEPQLADHPKLRAEALFLDGGVARRTGEHAQAKELLEQAFILAGTSGQNQVAAEAAGLLTAMNGLDLERSDEALLWDKLCEMMRVRSGDRGEIASRLALTRGSILRRVGKLEAAEDAFIEAQRLIERHLGPRHPKIAEALGNRANVASNRGQNDRAIELLRAGLALHSENYGPNHPDISMFTGNLGAMLTDAGAFEEAITQLEHSLALDRLHRGPAHPMVGIDILNLASVYRTTGEYDRATTLYSQSLEILEAALGAEHSQVAVVYVNFGWCLALKNELSAGINHIKKALAITKKIQVPDEFIAEAQLYLARAYWLRDADDEQAVALAHKSLAALAKNPKAFREFKSWSEEHLSQEVRDNVFGTAGEP